MILVLGEILFDELPSGRRPGGAAYNFAQHLHRMGHRVCFVSSIGGKDNNGEELLRQIQHQGLDPQLVQRHPEAPTGRVAVTVDATGSASYRILPNVAYDLIDFEALPPMTPEVVYFGSLIQRTTAGRERLQAYLRTLPESSIRFYDVNFRDGCCSEAILRPSLEQTDLLKLNNEELPVVGNLLGLSHSEDQLVDLLMNRFELRQVVLTCGANGCALFDGDGKTVLPPGPLSADQIVDTVGAGDSFSAMYTHAYLRGETAITALEMSTQLAEYICTIPGAIPGDNTIYRQLKKRYES